MKGKNMTKNTVVVTIKLQVEACVGNIASCSCSDKVMEKNCSCTWSTMGH